MDSLLLLESIFGGIELFLSSVKSFHLLPKDLVDVGNIQSLVRKLSGECRKLISKNSYFTFKILSINIRSSKRFSNFSDVSLLCGDIAI